jgi:class 3 adenylate cyclase
VLGERQVPEVLVGVDDGQVVRRRHVSERLLGAVEARAEAKPVGELSLKGFSRPVPAFNVVGLKAPET